jgi:hypothetical protein
MKRDRQNEKSIVLIKKEGEFSVASAITDPRLSYKATGLWMFLMNCSSDRYTNLDYLHNSKADGKDSLLSGLSELCEAGYLLCFRGRDSLGQWSSRYVVFENPTLKDKYLATLSEAEKEEIKTPSSPAKNRASKKGGAA